MGDAALESHSGPAVDFGMQDVRREPELFSKRHLNMVEQYNRRRPSFVNMSEIIGKPFPTANGRQADYHHGN